MGIIKNESMLISKYSKTAQFFQDIPFSLPFTYIALDQYFPSSKFILTVRDSPEQWYNSLISYHSKLWGENGKTPHSKDLKEANYIRKGLAWEIIKESFDTEIDKPYEKKVLIQHYLDYNQQIEQYFKHRSKNLLVLNVSDTGAYRKLCDFLGKPAISEEFSWENKT